jgi:hypothetical protein
MQLVHRLVPEDLPECRLDVPHVRKRAGAEPPLTSALRVALGPALALVVLPTVATASFYVYRVAATVTASGCWIPDLV